MYGKNLFDNCRSLGACLFVSSVTVFLPLSAVAYLCPFLAAFGTSFGTAEVTLCIVGLFTSGENKFIATLNTSDCNVFHVPFLNNWYLLIKPHRAALSCHIIKSVF
jgi:hypothetical protein